MDTRRRSGSNESWRPSTPDEPKAELVELSPVPQPKRRGMAPAALGVTLFAAGVLAGSSLVRLVPADVAVATTGPAGAGSAAPGSAGPTASPAQTSATPRATTSPQPTPRVTPTPTDVPWALTKSTFSDPDGSSPFGLWTVDGAIVAQIQSGSSTSFRTSIDGANWSTNYASQAITGYLGATVVGDRLWFVIRVAGLQDTHFEIGYPTWAEDGANVTWTTKGTAVGDAPDWVGAFARVGKTWVMSAGRYEGDGGTQGLWVSEDGVHWSTVLPEGAEDAAIYQLQHLGSTLVAFGQRPIADGMPVALVTTDGRTWTSAAFPRESTEAVAVYRMACTDTACVAVGSTTPPNSAERPAIWQTTDGLHWARVASEITDSRPEGFISSIVATRSGFIAFGQPEHEALLSRDGSAWQSNTVFARSDQGVIEQVTVNGNLLLAIGGNSSGGYDQWTSQLDALPFP